MIFHSIRASIKPGVPQEKVDMVFAKWREMAESIPAVQSFCMGRDIGGEFEYGAVFVLKDIEGYREFITAPIARETDEIGLPIGQNMVSFDITDDADPEIAEKIAEVHRTRFESDPELLKIVNSMGSYTGSGLPE